jgi:sporulation protein YlmC with PRC-barrel domain
MRKALLAAAAIAALASASATAQNTTTDNPSNGAAAGKMNSPANPGTMGATPTPNTAAPAAQTATQPVPDQGPNFIQVQNTDMLSSNVVGLDIHNKQNDNIGKIQDIAFDTSKKITGYILSVGGFLGMGTHYVAVNPDAVMVSYDAQNKVWKATMNATKDQLKAAPEFKYGGQWTASRS